MALLLNFPCLLSPLVGRQRRRFDKRQAAALFLVMTGTFLYRTFGVFSKGSDFDQNHGNMHFPVLMQKEHEIEIELSDIFDIFGSSGSLSFRADLGRLVSAAEVPVMAPLPSGSPAQTSSWILWSKMCCQVVQSNQCQLALSYDQAGHGETWHPWDFFFLREKSGAECVCGCCSGIRWASNFQAMEHEVTSRSSGWLHRRSCLEAKAVCSGEVTGGTSKKVFANARCAASCARIFGSDH